MKRLVIVGGGATGACVAINASKFLDRKVQIVIVEPQETLGLGKAYHTKDEENLLNVPAGNMGLYQDDPSHFENWLSLKGYNVKEFQYYPFVPRKIYGEYIQDCLKGIKCDHIRQRVAEVRAGTNSYLLKLDDQSSIKADFLVVATGYGKDRNIFSTMLGNDSSPKFLHPSEAEVFDFPHQSNILIVGSGLSAIDIWKRLRGRNDLQLTMTSRHGLIPIPHSTSTKLKYFPKLIGLTPLQILEISRALYLSGKYEWQQLADEIRFQSRGIWTCWSENEKKQFIRYIKPYWEVIRHRVPAAISSMLDADIVSNRLRFLPGKIVKIKEDKQQLYIDIKLKTEKVIKPMSFDFAILATGSCIGQDLFKNKYIEGVKLPSNGFGYINTGAPNIWFAGPCSKATYWEITAVPDIRMQSHEIVKKIEKRIHNNKIFAYYKFLDHPQSINESYLEHMFESMKFSKALYIKAFYSFIHALLPYKFTDNTSNDLRDISIQTSVRREKNF